MIVDLGKALKAFYRRTRRHMSHVTDKTLQEALVEALSFLGGVSSGFCVSKADVVVGAS